ncbi:MAG TPA: ATP-binding protein [Polyangiaceae bacterium]|nr:ATP-binding protein [Polyangiaceae bacterium]
MTAAAPHVSAEDLLLDGRIRVEDLVDRAGLEELCKSFQSLFGIPVRIYSSDGSLLGDAVGEHELCAYVNTTPGGRSACEATVAAVRARDPGPSGDVSHACFTGAAYRVMALEYEGRRVGRLVLGPFLPANVAEAPASLLAADGAIARDRAQALLMKVPRAKPETVTRIAEHLKSALDLILFAGHKAHVTSQMHLLSVRESYRQLEDKTAKLQEAFDRLKELDRLKSAFLATVSHELRTPLTSIIGYSEMLVEGLAGEMKPEQLEFVRTIHGKGEQLLSLISGLLDLGKLESGTMRMAMRVVRIESVLAEVVSTLAPTARRKGVRLELDPPGPLPELVGDPERLRQVFLNLVENAIKFTPAAGLVSLRASALSHDARGDAAADDDEDGVALLAPTRALLEVRVSDTGIGIPVRERAKVFDAFYQVDSSSTREYGGTGLGLSIVKRLVEAHSGAVRIEDNPPRGTTFVVSLPAKGGSVPAMHAVSV